MLLAGLSTRNNNKKILDTMTGWKEYSPLVEFESDATLKQVQDELIDGGNALLALLADVHPDTGAVLAAVENIKNHLDYEEISDTWVTAHVLVGKKTRLIANTAVREVSMSIFFHLSTMLDVHVLNLLCCAQATLQAIINCAHASFSFYTENMRVWLVIREVCMGLLSADAFRKYQELCDLDVFDKHDDENRRSDWGDLIQKCDSDDEEIDNDDYERQIGLQNDFEERSDDVRDQLIALDQLEGWSLYVEHKPVEKAAYRKILVSIFFLCMQCDIVVTSSHIIYSTGAIQP
jgi:hypothetical protein